MSCYLGEQKIPRLLVKSDDDSFGGVIVERITANQFRSSAGTSTATASVTLPSAPKWYKCYACGYTAVSYYSNRYVYTVQSECDIANQIQDDLVEITPTITNEGKTFSSSKSVTTNATVKYGLAVQIMILIYVL